MAQVPMMLFEDTKRLREKTPTEIMTEAFDKVNASLASDLMDMVMGLEPTEFETLVVDGGLHVIYGELS